MGGVSKKERESERASVRERERERDRVRERERGRDGTFCWHTFPDRISGGLCGECTQECSVEMHIFSSVNIYNSTSSVITTREVWQLSILIL